jgi:hypothetical protein
MELRALLEENREAILERWFELTMGAYPRTTAEFMAKKRDQFRNPVGYTSSKSIGTVFDQLVSGMEREPLLDALDGIIRIRSVQDLTPSEAIGFIFQLKTAIREIAERQLDGPRQQQQLLELESKVDEIALLGFEKYTECRERLHQIGKPRLRVRNRPVLQETDGKRLSTGQKREGIDGDG